MVDLSDMNVLTTKVIDFGFAANSTQKMQVFCGTPAYMSPEISAKQAYDGPAADVWAAGVLLFTMLFGYQPFEAPNEKDLFKKILKGTFALPPIVQGAATRSEIEAAAARASPQQHS